MDENNKYNRNILWVGIKGQMEIEKTRVAIVGLGGIGSHVAQQLAYLGVKDFVLIDADIVSKTNLNRLIGANEKDINNLKVNIAERNLKFISEDMSVYSVGDSFISEISIKALKRVNYIFGCVDKDGARLVLTEFSKAYKINYFDLASQISKDDWGGRVVFSNSEPGCLFCRGLLSSEEIRRDLSTPADRSAEDNIYGIPKEVIKNTGPAVVSLNGTIASIAVSEFISAVTSIRKVNKYLTYRGDLSILTKNIDPIQDCYYCKTVLGNGDKADIERYPKNGIDKILR